MLPHFLKKFEKDLKSYAKKYIKIEAEPVTENGNLLSSKFAGNPYWPISREWPKSNAGLPMILLAQINFDDVPALADYPTTGILQLFVSLEAWHEMNDFNVVFHKDMAAEMLTDFSFVTPAMRAESPIGMEHSLAFTQAEEWGGTEDFRFDFLFDGKQPYEYHEQLPDEEQRIFEELFYATGHKIGGYGYFTQTDPREFDEKSKNDVLLLQIDTADHIMFGDSGIAHIFINEEHLKNHEFDKAYFYWDCC